MSQPIPLLIPDIPNQAAIQPYLLQIDANRHYSNFGPLVKSLETRLTASFQQHAANPIHVTTVSSATLGLELTLSALNLPKGSRILVPALTFVATLTAIIRTGHIPVISDIDEDSWLLTPEIAQTVLKEKKIQAAIAVATFGHPQDTLSWSKFQKASGVKVIIDAASAFGSQWATATDIPIVFSMHATKSLTAGEGGFVVSGNAKLNNLIRQLSNFGINLDTHSGHPIGYISHIGTNAKLSEYHAAVAHASLDTWEYVAKKRTEMFHQYQHKLKELCGNAVILQSGQPTSAPTTLSIRVGSSQVRNAIEAICAQRNIATRRWYQPLLHHHSARIKPMEVFSCTFAERIATDMLGLPFSTFLGDEDLNRIATAVKDGLETQF
ncbi:MAG: aminotransferase DegT [Methylotenera sp.]|uniref:DegT/DnrJ/EryC1/StrS family aminotransferase n=1 Tax=Methylotenera sp. TaxID=2051956 RepID=UPI000D469FCE|nr:DegT/DnrJ/EryC1/StrS family aminotransferase [Methylotenera sp.]PPC81868.1 MAG: aminotransferase DegT [Methylotenera sp.]